ncbi:MAG TPA: flap endonuclease-1 [archaeon]|nr:flap endonuclease-1 [archaeon]
MGVQIAEILPKKEISIAELKGKAVAVDAFLWMHQFLSIIRQPDGMPLRDSKGRITSHLSGLFYRSANLLKAGVKLIYVFDGKSPAFKAVAVERAARKKEAEEKWAAALEAGDIEAARSAAQQTSHLTGEMIEQSKALLQFMGIPVVQAPSEGEAQCAKMCADKKVFAVASQDSDSLLFGTPRLVRNLSITGKRKMPGKQIFVDVNPQLIELAAVLKELEITREQLVIMGMLVGTDYNPGAMGYGPKKSLKLVKEEKTLEKVLAKIKWEGPPAESVFDFFMNPPAADLKIEQPKFQPEKILGLMAGDFEFGRERIEKVVNELAEIQPSAGGLGKWVK